MFSQITGRRNVSVRNGFTDYDTYGHGFMFATSEGNLDAPDYIPQGSIRQHNTGKPVAFISHAHRDWETGCMPLGCGHDGPEPAWLWLRKPA